MIIPIGYAQVNLIFTGGSVPTGAQCTFGIDIGGAPDNPGDCGLLVAQAWSVAGFIAHLSNDVDLTSVLVKFGPNATGPSAEIATSEESAGGTAGVPHTAFLVHKNTAQGGRAGRGRLFIPTVPEDLVNGAGGLDTTLLAAIQSDCDVFLEELDTSFIPMVLLHGVGSPLETPTPVTSLTVQPVVATQRRRLRR